jgi:hypothetical protein
MSFAEVLNVQHALHNGRRLCNTAVSGEPLVILIRVLTFIGFVVPDDASCRGTRSAVTGHVTRNAANYRTFNASLSIC